GGALSKSSLDARDRAFATDLVYGTLRWRGRIDHLLSERAPRGIAKLPVAVLAALRAGAYQILFSRSVPERAAVDETVKAVRALGHEKLTGLSNALLRRLARERGALAYPSPDEDPIGHAAAFHAHPAWIVGRLFALLGKDEALAFLEADNALPPLTLRANEARTSRDALLARLQEAGLAPRPGRYAPCALVLPERAPPGALPGFAEGLFAVQDEASQIVGALVDAQPGERVLDLCAAPGGKAAHLAARVGPAGRVVALDSHDGRLGLVRALCARLGHANVETVEGDAREPPPEIARGGFDRVLVDAPCTGLGVLRRNPDARWRVKPDAPARLARLQGEILDRARTLVRPGGVLIYSVCTFTEEETDGVMAALLATSPELVVELPRDTLGPAWEEIIAAEGTRVRTWPHRHGTDGFYALRMRRKG
ncbi:MAG: 16S rRNA (cytosine(967)-C(5))-methyltransferase RsmB, partial [Myxococcota bacterium]